jgi:hypothetical protein
MKTPKTREELEAAGYIFLDQATCKNCSAPILWFAPPRGKRTPFDADTLKPHWDSCPQVKEFNRYKRGKRKP